MTPFDPDPPPLRLLHRHTPAAFARLCAGLALFAVVVLAPMALQLLAVSSFDLLAVFYSCAFTLLLYLGLVALAAHRRVFWIELGETIRLGKPLTVKNLTWEDIAGVFFYDNFSRHWTRVPFPAIVPGVQRDVAVKFINGRFVIFGTTWEETQVVFERFVRPRAEAFADLSGPTGRINRQVEEEHIQAYRNGVKRDY